MARLDFCNLNLFRFELVSNLNISKNHQQRPLQIRISVQ